jgi:hypothetical protein
MPRGRLLSDAARGAAQRDRWATGTRRRLKGGGEGGLSTCSRKRATRPSSPSSRGPRTVSGNWRTPAPHHPGERAVARTDRTLGAPFYVKNGKDICYIKPDKDFIAFGFGEVVNPAREEGAQMHPVAWTLTSLDAAAEAKIRALVKKAVA